MKVAYVIPSLRRASGWRSYCVAVVRPMQRQVEPVWFVPPGVQAEAQELFPGCPVIPLPVTQDATLGSVRGLARLAHCSLALRRIDLPSFDLVHSLDAYPTGLVGDWLARRAVRPHLASALGTYAVIWRQRWLDRRAYRGVLRRLDLLLPISRGTQELVLQHFGDALAAEKVRTLLIGSDFARQVPASQALERSAPAVPTLLSVGDIKARKGQAFSLAAFARVKEKIPQARYWIVGRYQRDSIYYRMLEEFVTQRRLQDVSFLGEVSDEDLRRCYQQASVFVLTPRQEGLQFEGFGLVYLEAGAYGLPVVGTRSGGVPDAVQDGRTGLLVDPDDVDGIAGAILRLLSDPELARRLGRENRQWSETLTWERYAGQLHRVYQEVMP